MSIRRPFVTPLDYDSPSSSSFSERRFNMCSMASISPSERSSIFKRASVARRYSRTVWRCSDIDLLWCCYGGSRHDVMLTSCPRRRELSGVLLPSTTAFPVLRSRTGKQCGLYSALPGDSRKSGDSPELLSGTRERKVSVVWPSRGRRQVCGGDRCGSMSLLLNDVNRALGGHRQRFARLAQY